MRELYEIYLELGHDAFEEKIRKPIVGGKITRYPQGRESRPAKMIKT